MNIIYITLGLIILYLCGQLITFLGDRPVIFKNISLDNRNDLVIFFRILLYRGYAIRGKGDGRIYFENFSKKTRKIIVRKYNFRNEIGLIIYVPLYSKQLEKKIDRHLKGIGFKNKVWKETRQEVEEEVLGLDIKQDTSLGVDLFKKVAEYVFDDIEQKNLRVYFKNTGDIEEYYDFDLNKEEPNVYIREKLDAPVKWSTNLGYKLGRMSLFWRR